MGTIKCLDCDGRVSSNADFCPRCGNKRFREQWIAREERWKKEDEEQKKRETQKAKELGFSSVEDWKKAEKLKEFKKEFLLKYMPQIIFWLVLMVGLFYFL